MRARSGNRQAVFLRSDLIWHDPGGPVTDHSRVVAEWRRGWESNPRTEDLRIIIRVGTVH